MDVSFSLILVVVLHPMTNLPIESPLASLLKGKPLYEMSGPERDRFIGVKRLIRERGRAKLLAKSRRKPQEDTTEEVERVEVDPFADFT